MIETISTNTGVVVVDGTAQGVVKRDYDYKQGDARRSSREAAIAYAEVRAIQRGVRQQVRPTTPAIVGREPLWLIQDIG